MLWMLVLAGVRDQVGDQDILQLREVFFKKKSWFFVLSCRWPRSLTSLALEFGAR